MPSTIHELLQAGDDERIAISGAARGDLPYAHLRSLVTRTGDTLNKLGIGRNDRIAIVLPNGPGMATAFVAIACSATTAPLNPAYTQDEYDFYLSDLNARALVVEKGSDSPAVKAARAHNIQILELETGTDQPAGFFSISSDESDQHAGNQDIGMAGPEDIALVLHTSGTTSRPKIVPLSHRNVCASAANIQNTLQLIPDDVCLNIMPLFHIHGLMAAILASLGKGASVFCSPGFDALKFYAWLDHARPTWYTAVPTMHQTILARAKRNEEVIRNTRLRFIRSSSSSLPPQVLHELEKTFDVPVVEAYAMTEAAHQMTCNQLPPGIRKAGTVGCAAGPEVAIMAEAESDLLQHGQTGEIVIRGANVTTGYENNPSANAENFVNGWFRTGDQGVMDDDGYLTITGRLKEIINRGGEKISPREVDDVLMDHPAVQQVVTFAMPHKTLGEDVAAAVVLKEGESADEATIRSFAAERLASFKVPRKILVLEEIPKGATGKLQRIGLAKKLGLA
ncbi:MAG: acyl--CoA ligase [Proteobacteria bacterium]|nr:acyl--CoA ligase [Pseudomonadota bacterium]MDA0992630.1 acyl--CoA ligase [Pseudomonadota bacterium]